MDHLENNYMKMFKYEDINKYFVKPTFTFLYNELYLYIWLICFYHILFIFIILIILYILLKIFTITKTLKEISQKDA